MEIRRDDLDLTAELRALRPSPSAAFTDELDARAAAGFGKNGEHEESPLSRLAHVFRKVTPRRLALPAGAVTLAALAVATAVIAVGDGESEDQSSSLLSRVTQFSDTPRTAAEQPPVGESAAAESDLSSGGAGVQLGGTGYSSSASAHSRAVERDAELVLLTQPGEIGKVSKEVFGAVHAANGVVLSSSVRDQGGESSARFHLLVPSGRLGDTLASLSQIAEVRSRHESTLDITVPTVGVGDQLKDSEATIEGLLAQLSATESYEERALLERQLRQERQRAAALRSQLDQLQRRADFARISLRIESGSDAGGAASGPWGVDDALGDAGRILAIAAGVTVVSLAVIGPLALILLLAWLAHRAWMRQRRERALG